MPIIFGLDPSLRSTGYGIISVEGRTTRALAYGVIKNSDKIVPSRCLVTIHQQITDLLQQYKPDAAAVEGIIYLQNYQTAITLGSARGAALLALAEAGLPIYEYAPRRVKDVYKRQDGILLHHSLKETPPAHFLGAVAENFLHPVSYTHLDVYKRQRRDCRSLFHPDAPPGAARLRYGQRSLPVRYLEIHRTGHPFLLGFQLSLIHI